MKGEIMGVAILLSALLILSPAPIILAQPSTPHGPIFIENDDFFTPDNGVNGGGSGTQLDPYIIENWVIAADNHGICIKNTTKYFVIRNCLVENGRVSGIHLYNVINGKIENNTCGNNGRGIYLHYSDYCTIENNTCGNNTCGISLTYSNNNTITNCNIENNNNTAGIYISTDSFGNEAHYNNIVGNTTGISNQSASTVDATHNWWGTTDMVFIVNSIEGRVYAEPWLDAPYPGGESVDYWSMIEVLESDVDNLQYRVGVLENGVGTLENELEELISRVDAPENDTDNLTAQIESLKTEVDSLRTKISVLGFSISELDLRVSGLDENMSDVLFRISELEENVATHESDISNLESEMAELEFRVTTLEVTVTIHEMKIADLENQVTILMDLIDTLQVLVGGQASEIAGLQEDLASFIAGTQLWVLNIENRLSELGITDNTLWSALGNIRSDLENIELTPGPQGPAGPKGDTGPQGPQGPPGITLAEIEGLESRIEELETKLSELEPSTGTFSAPTGEGLDSFPWALALGAIAAVVLVGAAVTLYRLRGRPRKRSRK